MSVREANGRHPMIAQIDRLHARPIAHPDACLAERVRQRIRHIVRPVALGKHALPALHLERHAQSLYPRHQRLIVKRIKGALEKAPTVYDLR